MEWWGHLVCAKRSSPRGRPCKATPPSVGPGRAESVGRIIRNVCFLRRGIGRPREYVQPDSCVQLSTFIVSLTQMSIGKIWT